MSVSSSWTYTLSLHDALPISRWPRLIVILPKFVFVCGVKLKPFVTSHAFVVFAPLPVGTPATVTLHVVSSVRRSEEHTSELQSRFDIVCRLLLEKKNKCGSIV